jgi:hypothetical protein
MMPGLNPAPHPVRATVAGGEAAWLHAVTSTTATATATVTRADRRGKDPPGSIHLSIDLLVDVAAQAQNGQCLMMPGRCSAIFRPLRLLELE